MSNREQLIQDIDRVIANTPEKFSKNAELIDVLMRCKEALRKRESYPRYSSGDYSSWDSMSLGDPYQFNGGGI